MVQSDMKLRERVRKRASSEDDLISYASSHESNSPALKLERDPSPLLERSPSPAFMSSEGSSTSRPITTLPRGAACLPCRRRKMRCDGVRPFCGQCQAKHRTGDCEYPGDIQGLTRMQMMEENIALLEARIRELEDPDAANTSIKLYHPVPVAPSGNIQLLPTASPTIDSSQPSANILQSSLVPIAPVVSVPTAEEVQNLIHTFMPYASQMGFFLSIPQFLQYTQNTSVSNPLTHLGGPLYDALLSAVCLLGTYISSDPALKRYENYLVSRSVELLASSILNFSHASGPHGHAIIGVIQAEVLLANYFFSVGRFLEGRYHCGAAAAICVSCRLHALGEPGQSSAHLLRDVDPAAGAILPATEAPPDAIMVGERVNAFWTVHSLDTSWAIALGSPSALSEPSSPASYNRPNMMVSTPWPLRMVDYEQGAQVIFNVHDRPVVNLLSGVNIDGFSWSPPALRAQAATLYSHATLLASKYTNNMTIPESSAFWSKFEAMDNLITRFTQNFPPVFQITSNDPDVHELLVASTLTRGAAIQLHHRFTAGRTRSRDACVQNAQTIVATIQDLGPDVKFMDPIMAILLTAVCQVFMTELSAQRAGAYVGTQDYVGGQGYAESLTSSLERVLHVMTEFGSVCPLMNFQAAQVQASMHSLSL